MFLFCFIGLSFSSHCYLFCVIGAGPLNGFWFQVLSSSQIRVYWTSVPEPNGVVTKYVFQYWAKDPTWDHHRGTQYQNNPNANSYTLTGLNAYTTYTINGRAINGAGWGENTRLIAQTQEAGTYVVHFHWKLLIDELFKKHYSCDREILYFLQLHYQPIYTPPLVP